MTDLEKSSQSPTFWQKKLWKTFEAALRASFEARERTIRFVYRPVVAGNRCPERPGLGTCFRRNPDVLTNITLTLRFGKLMGVPITGLLDGPS